MTGTCGGSGDDVEDEGKNDTDVGVGRGHGEVLAGAGRSGGGEESVGDLLAVGEVLVAGVPSCFSCFHLLSVAISSVAAVSVW